MALVGNIIATAFSGNPSIINYDMFVAVFAMLSLFYLIAVSFNEGFSGHPALPLVLDILNALFFFCGAVATAAKLGVHSCGNTVCSHTKASLWFVTNRVNSPTPQPTASPTGPPTPESAATKPKPSPHSSFSVSHASQLRPSSPSSAQEVAVSTCVLVVSGKVGHPCLRSR